MNQKSKEFCFNGKSAFKELDEIFYIVQPNNISLTHFDIDIMNKRNLLIQVLKF